jgi:hypothetical protein
MNRALERTVIVMCFSIAWNSSSLTYPEANDKIIKDVIIIVNTRSNIDKANDDLE